MEHFGICELSVLPVRKNPHSTNELVTQILYGEIFTIIEKREKWSKISNYYDKYEGWVNNAQIKFIDKKKFNSIKSNNSVYCNDTNGYIIDKDNEKTLIPIGSLVSSCNQLKSKYIGKSSLLTKSNIIKTAKQYLNSPYLWGGRIPFGIDCSGFSQIVYKINGIKIKRDASQQANEGKITSIKDLKTGDLAFFGKTNKKATHVGIMINKNEIIHAFGKIRIDKVNNKGIVNSETKKLTHKLIGFRSY